MTKQEIIKKLEDIWKELDTLQETKEAQNNDELMWELGEAMGSVDNALSVLEEDCEEGSPQSGCALPESLALDLDDVLDRHTRDTVGNEIEDYLIDKYGCSTSSYGYEMKIKMCGIEWNKEDVD